MEISSQSLKRNISCSPWSLREQHGSHGLVRPDLRSPKLLHLKGDCQQPVLLSSISAPFGLVDCLLFAVNDARSGTNFITS
ncbi:unnamed protein product [Urochloa humidicola]